MADRSFTLEHDIRIGNVIIEKGDKIRVTEASVQDAFKERPELRYIVQKGDTNRTPPVPAYSVIAYTAPSVFEGVDWGVVLDNGYFILWFGDVAESGDDYKNVQAVKRVAPDFRIVKEIKVQNIRM